MSDAKAADPNLLVVVPGRREAFYLLECFGVGWWDGAGFAPEPPPMVDVPDHPKVPGLGLIAVAVPPGRYLVHLFNPPVPGATTQAPFDTVLVQVEPAPRPDWTAVARAIGSR